MSDFIYSAMNGKNDPLFGKFEHPIKALIENESNICEKKEDSVLKALFNIEKSNRYAETIMAQSDFSTFRAKKEGGKAENDSVTTTFKKTIEHIEFGKEFTITRKMAADAKFGMGSNMKNAPKAFVRAYYKTRDDIAAQALINGINGMMDYNGEIVDLSTADERPLFYKEHPYALQEFEGQTQSNLFYIPQTDMTSELLEMTLSLLANKMRNFKDENGQVMGYVPDVVIIPCNRPFLERAMKQVVGTERTSGTNHNDINTQYGNWTIVVLNGWQTDDDRFMVMSSEANENLLANMFYNREPLDITSDVDKHTRNYFWNGYCRFGIGFTTWKHIALVGFCSQESEFASHATELV